MGWQQLIENYKSHNKLLIEQVGEKNEEISRLRETLELADRIFSDAIFDLDHGEKVQGLEYGRKIISQALAGEANGQRKA